MKKVTHNVDIVNNYVRLVHNFSSQYGSESNGGSYVVKNIIGRTAIWPGYGDFSDALVFRFYGKWWCEFCRHPSLKSCYNHKYSDFIDVSFETAVFPVSLEIYETYNPGALVRISACNASLNDFSPPYFNGEQKWFTLWHGSPQNALAKPKMFSPPLRACPFKTRFLRLEFCCHHLKYYTELDAVSLNGFSSQPTNTDSDDYPYQPYDEAQFLGDNLSKLKIKDFSATDDYPYLSVVNSAHICDMPCEILTKIISLLDFMSICRLAQTCTRLRQAAYDTILYKDMDLKPIWYKITDSALRALRTRFFDITRLNLSWCGPYGAISSQGFSAFIRASGCNLTSLYVSACDFIDVGALEAIVYTCTNLTALDLSSCTKLVNTDFDHIILLRNLKHLNLYRSRITTRVLINMLKELNVLEFLDIGSCVVVDNFDDVINAASTFQFTAKLKSISLWRARSLTETSLERLFSTCSSLESIDLGWCTSVSTYRGLIVNLVKRCKHLRNLYLTANRTVSDNSLYALAEHCPTLEQLDILGSSQVTTRAVAAVVKHCRKLRMFDVSFCDDISFATIHEWRKLYPHIAFKKSFQNID